MSDRKAELDRKKAKLQQIRENKERKRRELELKAQEETLPRGERDPVKEVDDMLSSLGITPVSDVLSSLSSSASMPPDPDQLTATPPSSLLASIPASITPRSASKPEQLSTVKCGVIDIPAKEVISYAKQTQTTASGPERDAHAVDYYDEYNLNPGLEWEDEFTVLTFDEAEEEESSLPPIDTFKSKLPPGILPAGLPQVKEVEPAVTATEVPPPAPPKPVRELTEEEKQALLLSGEFQKFFDRSTRIVERALAESQDIYTDYTGLAESDDANDDRSSLRLVLTRVFQDERWSKNRCVSALDWSPHHPELLLTSYQSNDESHNDPDGVCLVWNTKFKKQTPEYIFHCQSPVTTACFNKFHPNLIIGGTYSGRIVLWDNRVPKRTPVHRTPLSPAAHTHPVYCLSLVGTQNAHNLIAISTDGRMCSWSLDMLSAPQETLELLSVGKSNRKSVAVTALAFPPNDVNNFLVGSEDGDCYLACRHGARAGVIETYGGHHTVITDLDVHSSHGNIDYSHLFLTSSFDWTIKLWSLKSVQAVSSQQPASPHSPLYSFENNSDIVTGVAWSPSHPSVFAAVDATGRLDVWNLNADPEVPTASTIVSGSPDLNRVSWSPNGTNVVAGDELGRVWVYEVGEGLSQPRSDEWNKLMHTLEELKNNQTDEDVEKACTMSSGYGSGPPSLGVGSASSLLT